MSRSKRQKRKKASRVRTIEYAAQGSGMRPQQTYQNFLPPVSESARMAQSYVTKEMQPVSSRRTQITQNVPEEEKFAEWESTQSEISDLTSRSRASSLSTNALYEKMHGYPPDFVNYVNPMYFQEDPLEGRIGFSGLYDSRSSRDLNREEVVGSRTLSPISSVGSEVTRGFEMMKSSEESSIWSLEEEMSSSSSSSRFRPIREEQDSNIIAQQILSPNVESRQATYARMLIDADQRVIDLQRKVNMQGDHLMKMEDMFDELVNNKASNEEIRAAQAELMAMQREKERFLDELTAARRNMLSIYNNPPAVTPTSTVSLSDNTPSSNNTSTSIDTAALSREQQYQAQLAALLGQDPSAIKLEDTGLKSIFEFTYNYPGVNQDNECFNITIQNGEVHVHHLKFPLGQKNCAESGPKLLNALKAFSEQNNLKLIIGSDASTLELGPEQWTYLNYFKILTKGQSWYNSQGFINVSAHERNVRANKALQERKLEDVINDLERRRGFVHVPRFIEIMTQHPENNKVKDLTKYIKKLGEKDNRTEVENSKIIHAVKLLMPFVEYESENLEYVPNSQSLYGTYN